MLPEFNPIELLFLGAFALVVIGPKDLPMVLRRIGQFTARMRGLAAEFRSSFDEMARQSELDELRKEVDALRSGSFMSTHTADLKTHVDEINQHLSTPYWEQPSIYGSEPGVLPASDASIASEADEVSALPPPTADVQPRAPRTPSKVRAAQKAFAPDSPSDVAAFAQSRAAAAAEAQPEAAPAPKAEPVKAPRKRVSKSAAAAPASPEVA